MLFERHESEAAAAAPTTQREPENVSALHLAQIERIEALVGMPERMLRKVSAVEAKLVAVDATVDALATVIEQTVIRNRTLTGGELGSRADRAVASAQFMEAYAKVGKVGFLQNKKNPSFFLFLVRRRM